MTALTVNGKTYEVDVEPDTPLLWVLRDTLGLTGTKFGCGIAQCGACTVHIDGAPCAPASSPVDSVGAKQVTTIEALAPADGNCMRCSRPGSISTCRNAAIANAEC